MQPIKLLQAMHSACQAATGQPLPQPLLHKFHNKGERQAWPGPPLSALTATEILSFNPATNVTELCRKCQKQCKLPLQHQHLIICIIYARQQSWSLTLQTVNLRNFRPRGQGCRKKKLEIGIGRIISVRAHHKRVPVAYVRAQTSVLGFVPTLRNLSEGFFTQMPAKDPVQSDVCKNRSFVAVSVQKTILGPKSQF